MASKKDEVVGNVDGNEIREPFSGVVQIYPDRAAASVRSKALVACHVHAVWSSLNAEQKRYSNDP